MTIESAIQVHKFLKENPGFLDGRISCTLSKSKHKDREDSFFSRGYTGAILKEEIGFLFSQTDDYSSVHGVAAEFENSEVSRTMKHSDFDEMIKEVHFSGTVEHVLNKISRWESNGKFKNVTTTENSVLLWPNEDRWPVKYDNYPIKFKVKSVEKERKFLLFKKKPFRSYHVFRFISSCIEDRMYSLPNLN
jgi:hypothetical protein